MLIVACRALFEAQLVLVTYWYISGRGNASGLPVIPPGLENHCDEWVYECATTVRQLPLSCDQLNNVRLERRKRRLVCLLTYFVCQQAHHS